MFSSIGNFLGGLASSLFNTGSLSQFSNTAAVANTSNNSGKNYTPVPSGVGYQKLPTMGEGNASFIINNPQYGYGGSPNPTALYQNYTPAPTSYRSGSNLSSSSGGALGPSYSASPAYSSMSYQAPSSTVVQAGTIGAGTPSVAVPYSPSATNYQGSIVGNNVSVGGDPSTGFVGGSTGADQSGKQQTDTTQTTDTAQASLDKYLASLKAPASQADAYNRAQTESGLYQAQQEKNNIQNSINGITSKMNTDLLQLRGTAAHEGVTEAVYGGQQAEITREATIQLLPLQAQLAVSQSNLELAQQHTDTLFKIYATDAQNSVDYYNSQAKAVYDLSTKQEQRQYDAQLAQKTYSMDAIKTATAQQNKLANDLLAAGDMAGYRAVTAIRPPTNINSPTLAQDYAKYQQDLSEAVATYGGKIGALERQEKQAQIDKITNDIANSQPIDLSTISPALTPYVSSFQQAIIGMPSQQAATTKQIFASALKSGDISQIKQTIINTAMSGLPVSEVSAAIGRQTSIDSLTNIVSLLKTAQAKGANTNLLTGTFQNVSQKLGSSGNNDLAYVGTQMALALNAYRKSVTGVAFNESELAQYKKIFPDLSNSDKLNLTNAQSLIDAFNLNNKSVLGFRIGQANYDAIFSPQAATQHAESGATQSVNYTATLDGIFGNKK